MNILVFNYEFPPVGGGGGVFTLDLYRELAKNHNIHLITSACYDLESFEIIDGIKVHRVNVLLRKKLDIASHISMLSYFPASILKGLILKQKFDIINAHFAIPTAPSALIVSNLLNIPIVLSLHGGDLYDPSKYLSPHKTIGLHYTVEKCINKSNRVIAQSNNTRENAYKYYNICKDIDVIPLGIPDVEYEKRTRNEMGFEEKDIILITIGRLIPRKAIHKLLSIIGNLKSELIKLLIIGSGPEMVGLKKIAKDVGIGNRVKFAGKVSDESKYHYLNISDIYVSTTMHEGFGIIYLEAMKSSLPIVTFDSGGQTDFLEDGANGYLIPENDTEGFTSRLRELINDKKKAKLIGNNNKVKFKHKFTIQKIAGQYEELFLNVLSR